MLCKKREKQTQIKKRILQFYITYYIGMLCLLLTYHIARRDLLLFTQSLSDTVREQGEENHVYKK